MRSDLFRPTSRARIPLRSYDFNSYMVSPRSRLTSHVLGTLSSADEESLPISTSHALAQTPLLSACYLLPATCDRPLTSRRTTHPTPAWTNSPRVSPTFKLLCRPPTYPTPPFSSFIPLPSRLHASRPPYRCPTLRTSAPPRRTC